MALSEHVFLYCERGTSGLLLAEPFNAASNAAFLLAALGGLLLLLRRPAAERGADQFLLVALVFLIGLGSLAFHLFATRGTELADVVPIGVFMLVYLGFALIRFLGVSPGWTVLLLIGFTASVAVTPQLKCWDGAIGFPSADVSGASVCLNGSLFYLPALLAMLIIGGILRERGHAAAPCILWAALIFAVSVTLRSLDLALCDTLAMNGRKVGTHFAWHVLNALVLFLLLRASFAGGRAAGSRARETGGLREAGPAREDRTFSP